MANEVYSAVCSEMTVTVAYSSMQSNDSPALSNSVDPWASSEGSLVLRGEGLSETSCVWTDSPGLSGYWGPQGTAEGRLRCGGETSSMRTEEELMEDYKGIYSTLTAIQVRVGNLADS